MTDEMIDEMSFQSYPNFHTSDDCDKCLERVGFNNLIDVPFLYLDRNDYTHKDVNGRGYHQYRVCSKCFKKGV